jgi:hypothetical protein
VSPWDNGTANSKLYLSHPSGNVVRGTVNAGGYELLFSTESSTPEENAFRLATHVLVAFMPAAGLAEMADTLADYWQYYAAPRNDPEEPGADIVVTGVLTGEPQDA